jgi:Taurine catabolism dioxygenase TauD, TfdA family
MSEIQPASIKPIAGANAWHGRDMAQSPRWQRRLDAAQLAEIDAAVKTARARALSWEEASAADFRLPGLAPLIDDIRDELENGSGLLMLRGIDVGRYDPAELRLLYAGLCRQIGTLVYSNRGGEIMREVRDVGADVGKRYGELPGRGREGAFLSSYSRTLSNGALRHHTDRCDVVALFCVRQAMRGGVSKLCSSPAVHNAMLARRPDLAAALYRDVWRSRFGEEDETGSLGYALPVWGVRNGKFTSHYSRTFVEAGQRTPDAPRVSEAQWQALDMLSDLADELSFEMSFTPGDIQFVNNHVIYHARTAFEDDAGAGCDRLLLRLWLAMPNSRALPHGHEVLWGDIEAGARRGGIGQTAAAPLR